MSNKIKKSKITLVVILVYLLVTIGVTIGICAYNYNGYIGYKQDYLDYYFNSEGKTNQTKVEQIAKWRSSKYTNNAGTVTYRDPITKEEITSEHISNSDSHIVDSYYKDNTLHVSKHFDVNLYAHLIENTQEDGTVDRYIMYAFYLSGIDYNQTEKNFHPSHIGFTFVEGVGELADESLEQVLQETQNKVLDSSVESTGQGYNVTSYTYTLLSKDASKSYGTYAFEDTAIDASKDDSDENQAYYIYQGITSKSYNNEAIFNETESLTFSIYYLNETSEGTKELINIVEGTFEAVMVDGKVIDGDNFDKFSDVSVGYAQSFNQDDYASFVRPKIIKTAIITFVVSGLVCALLGFVQLYNPEETPKKGKKK